MRPFYWAVRDWPLLCNLRPTVLVTFSCSTTLKSRVPQRKIVKKMRELLVPIKNKPLFHKLNSKHPKIVQAEFRDLFRDLQEENAKLISLELCSNRHIDFEKLLEIKPTFCSVTWHWKPYDKYDGSRDICEIPAVALAKHLVHIGVQVLLHFPGRYLNFEQAKYILNVVKKIGIRNLFVIQGDKGIISGTEDAKHFPYAKDLVFFIRKYFGNYFSIGVAGYPNKIEEKDFLYLKEKVDAGADFIITQVNFQLTPFEEFCQQCKVFNLKVPILPGVYIFQSYNGLECMSSLSNIEIPQEIKDVTWKLKEEPKRLKNYSMQLFKDLFIDLYKSNQVFCIHIFCLNNLDTVEKMYEILGFSRVSIERPL